MKKFLISILLFAASALSANAATIVLQSGNPAVDIKLSGGARLPLNGTVVIGFMRGYTTAMNSELAAPGPEIRTFLAANFVPIGVANADVDYGTNSVANPLSVRDTGTSTTAAGTIENSTWLATGGANVANSVQDGGLVRGTRIFLLAFNGSSLGEASELGIYSASTWTLSTSAAVNTLSMALTQVDQSTEVYRGSLGSLVLAPIVPEPSTAAFGLLLGLGVISRRRR